MTLAPECSPLHPCGSQQGTASKPKSKIGFRGKEKEIAINCLDEGGKEGKRGTGVANFKSRKNRTEREPKRCEFLLPEDGRKILQCVITFGPRCGGRVPSCGDRGS